MRAPLAYWAAVIVGSASLAVGLVILHGGTPSVGETSCARVVYNYLHAASTAVGVNLRNERLVACRQNGDVSVARVGFDVAVYGQTVHEILALRLVKSPWSVADVHQVG